MLYYWQKSYATPTEYTATGGVKIFSGIDEFIVSANRISENLWARWFASEPEPEEFARFFERVRASLKRLKKLGLVHFVRTAAGRRNYRYGSVWTFKETPFYNSDWLPQCRTSGFILSDAGAVSYTRDGLVNAVDLIGSKIIGERHDAYRYGEVVTNLRDRGMFHDYKSWIDTVAKKGVRGPRHTTVGAYKRPESESLHDSPTYMIYANFDFDLPDIEDNFQEATNLVKQFASFGIRPEDIICSWTGGKGFHVQVPGGAFNNPVFRRGWNQKHTLRFLAKLHLDARADPNLYNPVHLIRLIGSQHEKTGNYKRAFDGRSFLSMHPYGILQETAFAPFEIADPSKCKVCPELVEAMIDSSESDQDFDMIEYRDVETFRDSISEMNGTVRAALENGVAEGESWGNYVGRDMRMYVLAGHFWRKHKGDEQAAWEELQRENNRNSPPLPDYVIRRKLNTQATADGHSSRRIYFT